MFPPLNEAMRRVIRNKAAYSSEDEFYEALIEAAGSPWIPVEDALPPDSEWILFVINDPSEWKHNGKVVGGYYSRSDGYFHAPNNMYRTSHWMPAPPPPHFANPTQDSTC